MDIYRFRLYMARTMSQMVELRERLRYTASSANGNRMANTDKLASRGRPKPPLNLDILELSDAHVATVANIALYCRAEGTIPYQRISGVWFKWKRGIAVKALGLRGGDSEAALLEFELTLKHLHTYAEEVLNTPGIEIYLECLQSVWTLSSLLLPPSDVYYPADEIERRTGIKRDTFKRWVREFPSIVSRSDSGTTLYDIHLIQIIHEEKIKRRNSQLVQNRVLVAV